MPNSFKSVGVNGVLRDVCGFSPTDSISDINDKEKPYYLMAPLSDDYKRELVPRFNIYLWLKSKVGHYNSFMSSLFHSWRYAVSSNESPDEWGYNMSDGRFAESLSRFAEFCGQNFNFVDVRDARLKDPPIFISRKQYSALTGDQLPNAEMLIAFFFTGPNTAGDWRRSRHTAATRTFDGYDSIGDGRAFYIVLHCPQRRMVHWFTAKRDVFQYSTSQLTNDLVDIPANASQEGAVNIAEHTSSTFIKARLPRGYDEGHNRQQLLPLIGPGGSFFTEANTTFNRNTRFLWRIVSEHQVDLNPNRAFGNWRTEWCGKEYSCSYPKDNIKDYELSRDVKDLGKGKIYVAEDSVCYCPHSGFPLECALNPSDDQ